MQGITGSTPTVTMQFFTVFTRNTRLPDIPPQVACARVTGHFVTGPHVTGARIATRAPITRGPVTNRPETRARATRETER